MNTHESFQALLSAGIISYSDHPHDMTLFDAILDRIVETNCNPAKCVITLTWTALDRLTKRDFTAIRERFLLLECTNAPCIGFAIVEIK